MLSCNTFPGPFSVAEFVHLAACYFFQCFHNTFTQLLIACFNDKLCMFPSIQFTSSILLFIANSIEIVQVIVEIYS